MKKLIANIIHYGSLAIAGTILIGILIMFIAAGWKVWLSMAGMFVFATIAALVLAWAEENL